jgi:hypothetical protein
MIFLKYGSNVSSHAAANTFRRISTLIKTICSKEILTAIQQKIWGHENDAEAEAGEQVKRDD